MKKILIIIVMTMLCFICIKTNTNVSADESLTFNTETSTVFNATYRVTSRVAEKDLTYGMHYISDLAESYSSIMLSSQYSSTTPSPQAVNVLEVPYDTGVRIVNWTYSSSTCWTMKTIRELAEDFESCNPGWIVLAGVNGDYFDINSKQAFPRQTNGVSVNNGEVVRATSSGSQIGFTNNGTSNSLIGYQDIELTDHYLTIYDEDENELLKIKVDKFNEEPTGDEVALYFPYNTINDGIRETHVTSSPSEHSYLIEGAERCYPTSKDVIYVRGKISSTNTAKELYLGQCVIVTSNSEVESLLKQDTLIRVQQDVTGVYAECDNISGYSGITLLYNGEPISSLETNGAYRHPRTIIGKKEDGTIVLCTVDGRQPEKNMYGVADDEMAALMQYYGCVDAYNMDGGGSTTMIIRNSQGDFDVMNSPSDGSERSDSNAILVVVPQPNVKIDNATDTTVELSYDDSSKDITFDKVTARISDGTTEKSYVISSSDTITDLTPKTNYTMYCDYELTYNGQKQTGTIGPMTFKTGKVKPTVTDFYYEEEEEFYTFTFKINDPDETAMLISFINGSDMKFIKTSTTSYIINKTEAQGTDFMIEIMYDLAANPGSSITTAFTAEKYVPEPDPVEPKKGCNSGMVILELLSAMSLIYIFTKKH